jgi:hypothetical protein
MKLTAGMVLALFSTAALSCSAYLQHSALSSLPALVLRHPLRSVSYLLTSWRWVTGLLAGLGGLAFYIIAVSFAPLSLVQAALAGGVGLLALLVRGGGGSLSRLEWVAVAASVGGLLLLGLSLPAGTARSALPGWTAPLTWALAAMLLAGLAVVAGAVALRPGAGLAAAAGLLYSAANVATKAAVDRAGPLVLFCGLLLACHGLAFVCLQLSFQRGSALATAGVSTLVANTASILAGLIVFSEQVPGSAAGVLRGVGFAGAVLGATMLGAAGRAQQPAP